MCEDKFKLIKEFLRVEWDDMYIHVSVSLIENQLVFFQNFLYQFHFRIIIQVDRIYEEFLDFVLMHEF